MAKGKKYEAIIKRNENQPRIFKKKWMERLTYTTPRVIIGMYWVISAILIYIYKTMLNTEASVFYIVGWFIIGFFSWTLGEYILHRWFYHSPGDASYHKGHNYLFHGIHHEYPNDTSRIILPPIASVAVAAAVFAIVYGLFWIVSFSVNGTGNADIVFVFGPGFLNGYLAYMFVHYTVHTKPSPKKNNFWWRHHNIHHFQQHDRAFGVSSPIWDIVFRTMPEKGRKTIVEK